MPKGRPLIILILLIVAGTVLSACRPPNPDDQGGLKLEGSLEGSTETTAVETAREAQSMPLNNQKSVRTLADFEPIAATMAIINTTKGNVTIELYRNEAPLTTANFLDLAKKGEYDGIVFHRVIPDFMAQVGDPLTKDSSKQALWGTGGPGYTIADEFHPQLRHDREGIVSMANAGPNTGGSQFFITYGPTPHLDDKHAVFGQVVEGMEVVEAIEIGDKILSISLE
jgi:cyclophilin family peptidyl-prolyl cis-trans isomerase